MEKIALAINREGEPYFGAILRWGEGSVGLSAVGFGIDVGARVYWNDNSCGLTSVFHGKDSLGIHIKRSRE